MFNTLPIDHKFQWDTVQRNFFPYTHVSLIDTELQGFDGCCPCFWHLNIQSKYIRTSLGVSLLPPCILLVWFPLWGLIFLVDTSYVEPQSRLDVSQLPIIPFRAVWVSLQKVFFSFSSCWIPGDILLYPCVFSHTNRLNWWRISVYIFYPQFTVPAAYISGTWCLLPPP